MQTAGQLLRTDSLAAEVKAGRSAEPVLSLGRPSSRPAVQPVGSPVRLSVRRPFRAGQATACLFARIAILVRPPLADSDLRALARANGRRDTQRI